MGSCAWWCMPWCMPHTLLARQRSSARSGYGRAAPVHLCRSPQKSISGHSQNSVLTPGETPIMNSMSSSASTPVPFWYGLPTNLDTSARGAGRAWLGGSRRRKTEVATVRDNKEVTVVRDTQARAALGQDKGERAAFEGLRQRARSSPGSADGTSWVKNLARSGLDMYWPWNSATAWMLVPLRLTCCAPIVYVFASTVGVTLTGFLPASVSRLLRRGTGSPWRPRMVSVTAATSAGRERLPARSSI